MRSAQPCQPTPTRAREQTLRITQRCSFGGVLSPCLASVYLHRLDRQWADRGTGVLVRYADDLLAMCRTRQEAERVLQALTAILAELGLELKHAKTRIVHLTEGGEGLDFLGFHRRWCAATPRVRGICASSPAGAHGRPCSTHAAESRRSRTAANCWYPLNRSCRTSTDSCAAGQATSAMETPPDSSTRSATTRWTASRFIGKRHKPGWGYGLKVVPASRTTGSG